ncbi:MAG: family intrarane metalloprotease [Chthoniobacteraceae bacterium]|nr:family intrarane metalloprotease [Chthoniobacteraceae bacterium]
MNIHLLPLGVYRSLFPVHALGGIIYTGIVFSLLNAIFEELVFRGVLYDALESQWGAWGAVVATAAMFGYGHLRGYPPGLPGVVLAGIYGLALGWLRVRTGGLGLPIAAHIAADATIFVIVASTGPLGVL